MYRLVGFTLVVLSAVGFGFMAIFARFAYADGAGTATLLFLRFAVAGALMLALVLGRGLRIPRGKRFLGLILMGAVGYAGQSFCYFTALRYAQASLVALLLYIYPALVTALAAVFLKERVTGAKAIALVLALSGSALIVGLGGRGEMRGMLLAVGAAVVYALYIVCGSKLIREGESPQASAIIMLAAAAVFGLLTLAGGFEPPRSAAGLLWVAAIAVVSTAVAIVAFFAGLSRIGAADASMVSTVEPLVTVLASAAFLGEAPGPLTLVGGALILAALVVLSAFRGKESSR